jgi:hypothetical protein
MHNQNELIDKLDIIISKLKIMETDMEYVKTEIHNLKIEIDYIKSANDIVTNHVSFIENIFKCYIHNVYVYIPCVTKCSGKEVRVMKKSWMRFCIYITSLCTYLRCKKIKMFTYPPACYIC